MKLKQVQDNIYHVVFEKQTDLCKTFLRFQEYYESPKFRGEIFSLEQYKEWYSKEKGSWTYYTDWSGFNIPSYVLETFKKGKFNPLSKEEQDFLTLFEDKKDKFYIIGTYKSKSKSACVKLDQESTLKHEIAHGLFYTDPDYQKNVKNLLKKYDLKEIYAFLEKDYNASVLDDEAHAYICHNPDYLKEEHVSYPEKLHEELLNLFKTECS